MQILFWPFVALWRLITFVLRLTGRVVGITLGVVFVAAGTLLSLTGIGLVIGVPLIALGGALIVRGLFRGLL